MCSYCFDSVAFLRTVDWFPGGFTQAGSNCVVNISCVWGGRGGIKLFPAWKTKLKIKKITREFQHQPQIVMRGNYVAVYSLASRQTSTKFSWLFLFGLWLSKKSKNRQVVCGGKDKKSVSEFVAEKHLADCRREWARSERRLMRRKAAGHVTSAGKASVFTSCGGHLSVITGSYPGVHREMCVLHTVMCEIVLPIYESF